MIATLLLLAYATAVATIGPRFLRRAHWQERYPRAGIAAWQALSASTVAAVLLAGLSAAMPMMLVTTTLAEFLYTCAMLLRAQYATPTDALVTTVGLGVVVVVSSRIAWCVARTAIGVTRARRVQRLSLAVLTHVDPATGILVLEHAEAAAYCVPGRGGQVVVTSGALGQLAAEELEAVLAHERAHLRGRHDLVVATATALRDAFSFVPLFAAAADQVPRLVEMAADDVATRSADRRCLAHALLNLGGAPAPAGLLGAGGSTAAARVRRLVAPSQPFGIVRGMAAAAGIAVVLALPLALAAVPALAAVSEAYCPVSWTA
ncbi:integral membrane protein [Nocardioides phosphati]|uniref:Integral membrane protein n=1 Tax=Nocardioides phosphati TaxID=1867775 RepID=A0ABQ2N7M1_9ACTN|nr:M56 family metallopeptidase [Nocardioides phosphati]GGO85451.1 integral membrane protein [Nocardioides phosphati]